MEPSRNFTDADIEAIVEAINRSKHLDCRFEDINHEDLQEAVKFYKNVNIALAETKSTVRKTVISLLITGVFIIVCIGAAVKLKDLTPH
jgi:hypothetical protein